MAKYKDRRINRYYMFSGSDVFADGTSRGQSKNIYEPGTNIINNWDCVEGVLDYVFVKLGLGDNSEGIGRPVVMTEPVANLDYARKSLSNMLKFADWVANKRCSNVRNPLRMLLRAESLLRY